jgi:DNA-binding IclR family transcriptional regulator
MADTSPERVKALNHTLDILNAMADLNGASVTELAEEVGISKSAIYKHLTTLEQWGYVVQLANDRYDLGIQWLRYGGYARDRLFPLQRIQTAIRELANETEELVLFSTLTNGASMPIYHVRGEHAVKTDSYAGIRLPVHCTATGKAILAAMGEQAAAILDGIELTAHTENTITDRASFENDLAEIRDQGFALEDQERIEGMRGIGAAIKNETTEEILGALAVTGPTHRIKDERFTRRFPEMIANRAREIEINITYKRG